MPLAKHPVFINPPVHSLTHSLFPLVIHSVENSSRFEARWRDRMMMKQPCPAAFTYKAAWELALQCRPVIPAAQEGITNGKACRGYRVHSTPALANY